MITLFTLLALYYHTLLPFTQNAQPQVLAVKEISLVDRYAVKSVNRVFKYNMLLTLAYMSGKVKNASQVNWNTLNQPGEYGIVLGSHQTFAFHSAVLTDFKTASIKTTNAHFDSTDGFLSDGYLVGDGVCHLASFINWTARDANLSVIAPTNHNFAKIPEIPTRYGTAIYYSPDNYSGSALQNLYVTNTYSSPVLFLFIYKDDMLTLQILKLALA